MNSIKSLALAGMVATALFSAPTFATVCPTSPVAAAGKTQGSSVCIAPYGLDGSNTGLATVLGPGGTAHSIFSSGPGVDPYTNQVQKSYWSVGGSSGSVSTILLQIAGYAGKDVFGIFDPHETSNKLALISNGSNGKQAVLSVHTNAGYAVNFGTKSFFSTTNEFGFYLTTPSGTYYSMPSLNEAGGRTYPGGTPHMVAYQGNGSRIKAMNGLAGGIWGSNEYILAWEDLPFTHSDLDYNDFVVMVESVHPIPEPQVLGMFGLGALMIGLFAGLRRRIGNA